MKLKNHTRTYFEKNPIEEVIAQIRFPRNMEIESGLPVSFQKNISKDFPLMEIQESHSVSFKVGKSPNLDKVVREKSPPIFNFMTPSRDLRVSLACDFVALTCNNYDSWEQFYPKLEEIFTKLLAIYDIPLVTRVGLRYRNLISKEDLDLVGVHWSELINPSIIGHLATSELIDGTFDESAVLAANSVTQMKFEDFSLTLQTGLADKTTKKCFYIDADHYNELSCKSSEFNLKETIEVLHDKSSSVFRACIRERLYEALVPIKKED